MKHVLQGVPTEKLSPEREAELLRQGDKDTVISHNLREAAIYAKGSSQGRGLSDGELVSAAFDGLTAAIKNFKPNQITFFAYAKPYVRGALSRATRSNCVVRTVREAEPLPAEEPDEEETSYVPPRKAEDHHEPALEAICLSEEWQQIRPVLFSVLDEKERIIVELSYIGGLNLREISDLLGVSRSDIHHGRMEALRKVRNRLMDDGQFSRE